MQGGPEILMVLFIILLLFGAKRLPELSRSLGKSLGEFKRGKEDLEHEIRTMQAEPVEPIIQTEPQSDSEGDD
jgi:sec-independent protein translocase protein TatA